MDGNGIYLRRRNKMTTEEQVAQLKREVEELKVLFFKDSYSDLQVFRKNVVFKGDVTFDGNSRVRAYLATSAQSIADDTITKVAFNAESYDSLGEFASNKFIATKAGYYSIHSAVLWNAPVDTKSYQIFIYKNNAEIARDARTASGTDTISSVISDIVSLAVGDYIETFVYHNSGGAKTIFADSAYTYLSISKI